MRREFYIRLYSLLRTVFHHHPLVLQLVRQKRVDFFKADLGVVRDDCRNRVCEQLRCRGRNIVRSGKVGVHHFFECPDSSRRLCHPPSQVRRLRRQAGENPAAHEGVQVHDVRKWTAQSPAADEGQLAEHGRQNISLFDQLFQLVWLNVHVIYGMVIEFHQRVGPCLYCRAYLFGQRIGVLLTKFWVILPIEPQGSEPAFHNVHSCVRKPSVMNCILHGCPVNWGQRSHLHIRRDTVKCGQARAGKITLLRGKCIVRACPVRHVLVRLCKAARRTKQAAQQQASPPLCPPGKSRAPALDLDLLNRLDV